MINELRIVVQSSVSTRFTQIDAVKLTGSTLPKGKPLVALPVKNIKVITSFYKGMHDTQRCLRF